MQTQGEVMRPRGLSFWAPHTFHPTLHPAWVGASGSVLLVDPPTLSSFPPAPISLAPSPLKPTKTGACSPKRSELGGMCGFPGWGF